MSNTDKQLAELTRVVGLQNDSIRDVGEAIKRQAAIALENHQKLSTSHHRLASDFRSLKVTVNTLATMNNLDGVDIDPIPENGHVPVNTYEDTTALEARMLKEFGVIHEKIANVSGTSDKLAKSDHKAWGARAAQMIALTITLILAIMRELHLH